MANTNTVPSSGSWEGQIPSAAHPAAADRYHLYVGLFCPFAHRVLIARELKGLQDILPMSIVRPYPKNDGGWRMSTPGNEYPGSTEDHLFGSVFLHEVYFRSPPTYKDYQGKYSVPVLWDKQTGEILNNESEQIARMLNTAFNDFIDDHSQKKLNLYPEDLRPQIDEINAWLVPEINSGVYKAGFAPDQETYDENCRKVFAALDRLEAIFAKHGKPFVLGDRLTELDVKAYATLVRFDTVYVQHFKLNMKTIRHDYKFLNRFLKHLYYKVPGFRETTDFKHIKENYTKSHTDINPKGITPLGPVPDVEEWTEDDSRWLGNIP